jgi:hypothetical protein
MKRVKEIMLMVVILGVMAFLVGCITTKDPVTGHMLYQLDPCSPIVHFVDSVFNNVPVITAAATTFSTLFFPVGVPIITAIGGILVGLGGMWSNMKPKITEAKTLTEQATNILGVSFDALLHTQQTNPALWKTISDKFAELLPKGSSENLTTVLQQIQNLATTLPNTGV